MRRNAPRRPWWTEPTVLAALITTIGVLLVALVIPHLSPAPAPTPSPSLRSAACGAAFASLPSSTGLRVAICVDADGRVSDVKPATYGEMSDASPPPNDTNRTAPGELVHFRYRIEGGPISRPTIGWVVHRETTREEVGTIPPPSGFIRDPVAVRQAAVYEGTATVWVRIPDDGSCYYITVIIRDQSGELARADTLIFRDGRQPGSC